MKKVSLFILVSFVNSIAILAQSSHPETEPKQEIYSLIDNYTKSRETQDTALLNSILTPEIDQLVSTGEWRFGKTGAMKGMMRSSESNPGKRTITIDKIRLLNPECAIVDARYEIQNVNGTARKMWSTFIVVNDKNKWKIAAIRNMLPARSN